MGTAETQAHQNAQEHNIVVGEKMTTTEAIMIAEGDHDVDESTWINAWQHLINTGMCWQLQGWFGRQAEKLINEGICVEAKHVEASKG